LILTEQCAAAGSTKRVMLDGIYCGKKTRWGFQWKEKLNIALRLLRLNFSLF